MHCVDTHIRALLLPIHASRQPFDRAFSRRISVAHDRSIRKVAATATFFQPVQFVFRRLSNILRGIRCPFAHARRVDRYVSEHTAYIVSMSRVKVSEGTCLVGHHGAP